MYKYYEIVKILCALSISAPLLVGLIQFRYNKGVSYRIVMLYFLCAGGASIGLHIFGNLRSNNLFVFHVYTLLEFFLLMLLYRNLLHASFAKRVINRTLLFFLVFKVVDVFFVTGFYQFDALAVTIESATLIVLSLWYFSQLLNERTSNIKGFPPFWINSGILIYFSSSFFIFLFSAEIINDVERYYLYWSIHDTLVIVRDLLFTVAMAVWYRSMIARVKAERESVYT